MPFDNSSKFARKVEKLKHMILHSKQNAIEGAKMGFMIGGLFGFMLGCYSAVQTRRFMVIPISTICSMRSRMLATMSRYSTTSVSL